MGYNKKPGKKMKAGGSADKPTYYGIGGALDKKLGGGMLAQMNLKQKRM